MLHLEVIICSIGYRQNDLRVLNYGIRAHPSCPAGLGFGSHLSRISPHAGDESTRMMLSITVVTMVEAVDDVSDCCFEAVADLCSIGLVEVLCRILPGRLDI